MSLHTALVLPNSREGLLGYASRTLTTTEYKYSQIEKEGLDCVYGLKKFHPYLYGHHFSLVTDHKPLHSPFKENHAITPQALGRIQCWALTLAV